MDDAKKLETADIAYELEKLARSGVFKQRTSDACEQAAWLVPDPRVDELASQARAAYDEEYVRRWVGLFGDLAIARARGTDASSSLREYGLPAADVSS